MAPKKKSSKKKSKIVKLKLVPEDQKIREQVKGFFYVIIKNPRMEGGTGKDGKVRLKKYCPHPVNDHVWFKETKHKK